MQQIGPYKIQQTLGRGGMGVVLKALDVTLQRAVAIKLLAPELAQNREVVERFLREARAMARINDPNVVQVYGADEQDSQPYMAMEFVDGADLSQILKTQGKQRAEVAVEWIRQAALGTQAAHDVGLLHRDIKLSNLMLSQRGVIKVADFGIALAHMEQATRLTGTGGVIGTPGYLAPEVCLGAAAGPRSDVYALGVALFELLSGRRPFVGDTPMAIMMQAVDQQAPDVRTTAADIDENLAAILTHALAKSPEQRIASCAEFAGLLTAWQHGQRASSADSAQQSAQMLDAARNSAKNVRTASTGRFASFKRLNLLAASRRPLWLMLPVLGAFALSFYAQYWFGSGLYADLGKAANENYGVDHFAWIKRWLLFTGAASVLAYATFSYWFLRCYEFIVQARSDSTAALKPKDARLALLLISTPLLQLYFSFRLFQALQRPIVASAPTLESTPATPQFAQTAVQQGPLQTVTEPSAPAQSNTLLWLWWMSFYASLALSTLAWYLLPSHWSGGQHMSYAFTLELFARGLWMLATILAAALMLHISWRIARVFKAGS